MKKNITKLFFIALMGMMVAACGGNTNEGKTEDNGAMETLKKVIAETQKQMPIDFGMMKYADIFIEDNYVVNVYECDDESMPIAEMKDALTGPEARESGLNILKANTYLVDKMKAANCGYIIRYVGTPSGETAELKYEADEL